MNKRSQYRVSRFLRSLPRQWRPAARALIYGAHCRCSNAWFFARNPRLMLRVYRLTRLLENGRTEIEA